MKSMNEDRFRLELELRAWDLRQSLRGGGQLVIERVPDDLDATLLAAERESATNELKRTLLLRQVEVALERLQAGKYGSCINCGQEIPENRLNAVPWAIYCTACQEVVDRVQARVQMFQKSVA
jgi:DnaK suppressor protein